ncbi:MAG: hypothetical protein HY542_05510 [Deltaproteobacteria bacterium]|nr:hypothetical protein [Deltaproteobacteria bacterium]
MKKKLSVLLLLVSLSLVPNFAIAANVSTQRPNAVYFEGLGRGFLYSVGYDRFITPEIAVGGGLSYWSAWTANVFVLPAYGSYYFYPIEPQNHRFFATAGLDLIIVSGGATSSVFSSTSVAGTLGGGYEYRHDNGLLLRAGPYIIIGSGGVTGWGGLTAGYSF